MAGRMINGAAAALAGLVRPASEADEPGVHRVLPVVPELSGLLPGRGLRRGSTVAVATGASGATSLLLALLAAASRSGSWCAVVGVPDLGALAAAESGIALDRLALVPNPGPDWPTVVGALIDGVDVVVTAVPGPVAAGIATRLAARARQRGAVLVPFGAWSGADVTLRVTQGVWEGLGQGRGRLRRRRVTVLARGRGAAARPRETTLWMPGLTLPPPFPPAPAAGPSDRGAVERTGQGVRSPIGPASAPAVPAPPSSSASADPSWSVPGAWSVPVDSAVVVPSGGAGHSAAALASPSVLASALALASASVLRRRRRSRSRLGLGAEAAHAGLIPAAFFSPTSPRALAPPRMAGSRSGGAASAAGSALPSGAAESGSFGFVLHGLSAGRRMSAAAASLFAARSALLAGLPVLGAGSVSRAGSVLGAGSASKTGSVPGASGGLSGAAAGHVLVGRAVVPPCLRLGGESRRRRRPV